MQRAVNLKQNSDLVAAREASAANRYKIKAEFYVNATRDTPALFYVVKACIIKACIGQDCAVRARIVKACIGATSPVGQNFTTSYELQDAAHPHRLDLKFKAEF